MCRTGGMIDLPWDPMLRVEQFKDAIVKKLKNNVRKASVEHFVDVLQDE